MIVVIVCIGLIYLGGFAGLAIHKDDNTTSKSYTEDKKKEKDSDKSLSTRIGEWMGTFAKRFDVEKLLKDNKTKTFTGKFECDYELNKTKDSDGKNQNFYSLNLTKSTPNCVIKVRSKHLDGAKYRKAELSMMNSGESVSVTYRSNEKDSKTSDPEKLVFGDSFSVVVMKEGGTLTIVCNTCNSDSVPVKIKFE